MKFGMLGKLLEKHRLRLVSHFYLLKNQNYKYLNFPEKKTFLLDLVRKGIEQIKQIYSLALK